MPTKNIVVVFKHLMSNQELQNSNYCMCVWNTLHYIYKLGTLVHLIRMYWTEYNLKHLEATVIMIWCCKNNTDTGDYGVHLSTVNSLSYLRNYLEMNWAL